MTLSFIFRFKNLAMIIGSPFALITLWQATKSFSVISTPISLMIFVTICSGFSLSEGGTPLTSMFEFASMFDIPCKQPPTYLPYDSANKVFSLKQARTHCEYVRLLDDHKKI